jgi:hypothetical protein
LRVSKEPHSGPAPPQLLNKSEAEKHDKTNDRSFLSSFIGILTISSDTHDDIALFCLPLFFVKVAAISAFGRPLFGLLGRRLQLFRIESEYLELPAPFGRQIAETLDADAAGPATFHGSLNEIRRKEGKRYG